MTRTPALPCSQKGNERSSVTISVSLVLQHTSDGFHCLDCFSVQFLSREHGQALRVQLLWKHNTSNTGIIKLSLFFFKLSICGCRVYFLISPGSSPPRTPLCYNSRVFLLKCVTNTTQSWMSCTIGVMLGISIQTMLNFLAFAQLWCASLPTPPASIPPNSPT